MSPKRKYTPNTNLVQLTLWDISTNNPLVITEPQPTIEEPLPLRTAAKWKFPLTHIDQNENSSHYLYLAQDWYLGLGGEKSRWSRTKNELLLSKQQLRSTYELKFIQLPYVADNGKTYQMDFTDDKGLYLIAQEMRSMKKRPQLDEIKRYLAESGAFVDLIMRDAAAADAATQMLEERHEIARKQGKLKRNLFTDVVFTSNVNHAPKYGVLTNIEYKNLFRLNAEKTATNELISVLNLDTKQAKHLRDHLSTLALSAVDAAETTAAIKMQQLNRLLTDSEQSEIVRQCARKVSGMFWELAEFAGIDLVTGQKLLMDGKS